MPKIYVIGHRNPDTDSICAAIAYAHFIRETQGRDAQAARCGEINTRTQFVLDETGLQAPKLLMDVRPTAGQICQRVVISAAPDEAFYTIYRRMHENRIRAIPVIDKNGTLLGILPLLNLLELLIPHHQDRLSQHRRVETSLARIAEVLGGTFEHAIDTEQEDTLMLIVGAMSKDSFSRHLARFRPEQTVIVTGDRPAIHEQSIRFGARCLVITGGFRLSPSHVQEAKEKGVSILSSPLDTTATTLLIRGCSKVNRAIQTHFLSFPEGSAVKTIRAQLEGSEQELFPVLDSDDRCVGVFSKSNVLDPPRARLILVDHNEMSQAVSGVEEADIEEVIDHHRVGGGLVTRDPIRFVNEPVGSTCTIIARFMQEKAYVPPREIAVCLAMGIISDTLHLASPTTTETDRSQLAWLSECGSIDTQDLAARFFAAGSLLQRLSASEALESDCKSYSENGWSFSISQLEEVGTEGFTRKHTELAEALATMVTRKQLDFACLMMTDITQHASMMLVAGNPDIISAIDYPRMGQNLFQLDGVVSRKKQLLPHISRLVLNSSR